MNEEKTPIPQSNQVIVKFKEDGLVHFHDQNELSNAAKLLLQMNLAPEHLRKEGLTAVMSALTFCKQFRLPYSAMNELGYIKGKLGAYGSLFTALSERHPDYGEMIVLYVNDKMDVISLKNKNLKDEVFACVIRIKKKSDSEWHEYYFTRDEAKAAGLLGNNTYQKYLKDMLYHKAKSRALKTEYSSALNGVESFEVIRMESDLEVTPAQRLNSKFNLIGDKESDLIDCEGN